MILAWALGELGLKHVRLDIDTTAGKNTTTK